MNSNNVSKSDKIIAVGCFPAHFHATSEHFPKKQTNSWNSPFPPLLSSSVCLFTARRASGHLLAEVIGENRITLCVTVRETQGLVCQPCARSGRRSGSHVQEHAERLTAAEVESCRRQLPHPPRPPPRWEIKNLTYSIKNICMHAVIFFLTATK